MNFSDLLKEVDQLKVYSKCLTVNSFIKLFNRTEYSCSNTRFLIYIPGSRSASQGAIITPRPAKILFPCTYSRWFVRLREPHRHPGESGTDIHDPPTLRLPDSDSSFMQQYNLTTPSPPPTTQIPSESLCFPLLKSKYLKL